MSNTPSKDLALLPPTSWPPFPDFGYTVEIPDTTEGKWLPHAWFATTYGLNLYFSLASVHDRSVCRITDRLTRSVID